MADIEGRQGYAALVPSEAAFEHAPWSASKIACAARCPLEFRYRYIERISEKQVSPEARLGKAVHLALELALSRSGLEEGLAAGRKQLLTEPEKERYETLARMVGDFTERVAAFRSRRRVRVQLLEHRVAVDAQFRPTGFIAKNAFFRGVWDAGFLFGGGVLAVVDHKTGIRRSLESFADQLEGYAAVASAIVPRLRKMWIGVHFVADGQVEWQGPLEPDRVKDEFVPRLLAQIEDAAANLGECTEPRPSSFCQICSYQAICPAVRGEVSRLPPLSSRLAASGDLFDR